MQLPTNWVCGGQSRLRLGAPGSPSILPSSPPSPPSPGQPTGATPGQASSDRKGAVSSGAQVRAPPAPRRPAAVVWPPSGGAGLRSLPLAPAPKERSCCRSVASRHVTSQAGVGGRAPASLPRGATASATVSRGTEPAGRTEAEKCPGEPTPARRPRSWGSRRRVSGHVLVGQSAVPLPPPSVLCGPRWVGRCPPSLGRGLLYSAHRFTH